METWLVEAWTWLSDPEARVSPKNLFEPIKTFESMTGPEFQAEFGCGLSMLFLRAALPNFVWENDSWTGYRLRSFLLKKLENEWKNTPLGKNKWDVLKYLLNAASAIKENRQTIELLDEIQKQNLLASQSGRCAICGYEFNNKLVQSRLFNKKALRVKVPNRYDRFKPILRREEWMIPTIDHVIPISEHGTNDIANLYLVCGFCNNAKGNIVTLFSTPRLFSSLPYSDPRNCNDRLFPFLKNLRNRGCQVCGKNVGEVELTFAPRDFNFPLSILNSKVTCYAHDPLSASKRWINV